jgi:TonB family protein
MASLRCGIRCRGTLQLRLVVDPSGVPLRIAVARPLGYGLDPSAVEAMTKWRFAPGMKDGAPVVAGVVVERQFNLVAAPH